MSKVKQVRHENPYRSGDYNVEFAYWQKKQWVTRQEMVDFAMNTLGKTDKQAIADVNVILSPRMSSKIGDCRGNISARGDLYFALKAGRSVRLGVKSPQKFGLKWRKVPLARKTRNVVEVKQIKTKAVEKVKTPAKVEDKVE